MKSETINFGQDFAWQAIETRYVGPTNFRGARIVATSECGFRSVYDWDHELDQFANHREAARRFAAEHEWFGDWVGGATKRGYCFVRS